MITSVMFGFNGVIMKMVRIRKELLERKVELESRLERTHKHIYFKDEPISSNWNDQLKQTENDALVMALEADHIAEIAQISSALERIEDKYYQFCSLCGEEIGEDRLKAIPYTNCCINCAT